MNITSQISAYLNSLPAAKKKDMEEIHGMIFSCNPDGKLWFLDGKDETGKVVSNPNIGYGQLTLHYKDGSSREFYQVGLSANTGGISVYIMGLEDKTYLAKTYGEKLGKASITGYCIKFKSLKHIDTTILSEVFQHIFGLSKYLHKP